MCIYNHSYTFCLVRIFFQYYPCIFYSNDCQIIYKNSWCYLNSSKPSSLLLRRSTRATNHSWVLYTISGLMGRTRQSVQASRPNATWPTGQGAGMIPYWTTSEVKVIFISIFFLLSLVPITCFGYTHLHVFNNTDWRPHFQCKSEKISKGTKCFHENGTSIYLLSSPLWK